MSLFRPQTGKFKDIPCPFIDKCKLGNCFYSHDLPSTEINKKRKISSVDKTAEVAQKVSKVAVPAALTNSPAPYQQRVQFLNVLRDKLQEKGVEIDDASDRAVKLEAEVAERTTKFTYPMGIRTTVREILTGALFDSDQQPQNERQILNTELVNLLVPRSRLEKHGYVMEIPDKGELDSRATVNCSRCSTTFPIFHRQPPTARCDFHLMKREYDPNIKRRSNFFPCCNQSLEESSGCEHRDFHVFKLEQPSLMQAMQPFVRIPDQKSSNKMPLYACGIDCEMAWTTKGFELIRVTVVDYESRMKKYDRLVWPKGEILDLNTRFSGISDMNTGIIAEDGELRLPVNWDVLYSELFDIISNKTILIGHGLENDLNVLRLTHDRIVDTAILLPRNKTRTHALKDLAWEFLGRTIQTGEHDSMEDALAAIDIIQKDIQMRCFPKKVKSF